MSRRSTSIAPLASSLRSLLAATLKGRPTINRARAKQLYIDVASWVLLSSEIVTDFEWNTPA